MSGAPVHLTLLGGFRARAADGATIPIVARKSQALLAFLAVVREPRGRDKLASLLWSESGDELARTSLRQALSKLKKSLPKGVLLFEGDAVVLDHERVSSDVAELERAAESDEDSFERSIASYEGDLLEGLNTRSPAFDEWLMRERERIRLLALGGMRRLLDLQVNARKMQHAITTAARLLSFDPLDESVHRKLIELYAATGQRAAALRHFNSCREMLRRELGVEPEPATVELHQRVRDERHRPVEQRPPEDPEERQLTLRPVTAVSVFTSTGQPAPGFDPILQRAAERFEGTITRRFDDSAMMVFGARRAHSNDPERAVRAALMIRDRSPAPVQIGVASGLVLSGRGEALSLASRLGASAEANQIQISRAVHEVVGGQMECMLHSEDVWLVEGLREKPRSGGPFVARRAELEQLEAIVRTVDGSGRIVLISGEAGIGKTTLLERTAVMAEARGFALHTVRVLDFGVEKGQDPTSTIVRSLLASQPSIDRRAIERAVAQEQIDQRDAIFLADLLDLSPSAAEPSEREAGILRALRRLVLARAAERPLLIGIEDVHWADPQTSASLFELMDCAGSAPLVLVMTCRTEEGVEAGWHRALRRRPATALELPPLDECSCRQLAESLEEASGSIEIDVAIERANGNPFFLLQILRSESDGDVPSSIQSLVASRLDALLEMDRRAVRAAAVLGQTSDLAAVRHLIQAPDYEPRLPLEVGFFERDRELLVFTHALFAESVYATTLDEERRRLHERAAEWYRSRDRALLAQHLDRAEDPSAANAYLEAAQSEISKRRRRESLALLERGLELAGAETAEEIRITAACVLRDLGEMDRAAPMFEQSIALATTDRTRSRAWLEHAKALRLRDRFAGALHASGEAKRFAERARDLILLTEIHTLEGNLYFPLGDQTSCLSAHERAFETARRAGSKELEARALSGIGDANYLVGRMRTAGEYFGKATDLARECGFPEIEIANMHMRAMTRLFDNELAASAVESFSAAERARAIGDLRGEMIAHAGVPFALSLMEDWTRMEQESERCIAIARMLGSRRFEAAGLVHLAEAKTRTGGVPDARAMLEEAYRASAFAGHSFIGPYILVEMAATSLDAGGAAKALEEAEALLALPCVWHNHFIFRRKSIDLCLACGDWVGAERHAALLSESVRQEPLPICGFIVERARALARLCRGERSHELSELLRTLLATAASAGLEFARPALQDAVASL